MTTDTNVNVGGGEFDIPFDETPAAEAADAPRPAEGIQDTLKALAGLLEEPEAPAAEDPPAKPEAPAAEAAPEASEIDTIMEALADEPEGIRTAVRAALEKGVKLEAALAGLQQERAEEANTRLAAAAEEALVAETTELATKYPGLTEKDLTQVLVGLSKLPKALAEELTLEEAAARTLGRDTLEARRTAPGAPGGKTPSVPRTADPAVVIGDATPGPGSAEKPFDAGSGGDFMDIANHVTRTAGSSLVSGGQR